MVYSLSYKVAYTMFGEKLLDATSIHFEILNLIDVENALERINSLVKHRSETIYILKNGKRWPKDLTDEEVRDAVTENVEKALDKVRAVERFLERLKWEVLEAKR